MIGHTRTDRYCTCRCAHRKIRQPLAAGRLRHLFFKREEFARRVKLRWRLMMDELAQFDEVALRS